LTTAVGLERLAAADTDALNLGVQDILRPLVLLAVEASEKGAAGVSLPPPSCGVERHAVLRIRSAGGVLAEMDAGRKQFQVVWRVVGPVAVAVVDVIAPGNLPAVSMLPHRSMQAPTVALIVEAAEVIAFSAKLLIRRTGALRHKSVCVR
jgi:hypothetical protein